MPPFINSDECKKCHMCVEACQSDVFYGSTEGEVPQVTYPDECWHCNACVIACPTKAVEIRLPIQMSPVYQEREEE